MSIEYIPPQGDELGYWHAYDPTIDDMEDMVFELGRSQWFNFVVVGKPCEISPEWIAKHEGYTAGNYDYAVSFSIQSRDVGDMLDDNESVVDAFNYFLEGTGKCWEQIDELKLVNRRKPWDDAVI